MYMYIMIQAYYVGELCDELVFVGFERGDAALAVRLAVAQRLLEVGQLSLAL